MKSHLVEGLVVDSFDNVNLAVGLFESSAKVLSEKNVGTYRPVGADHPVRRPSATNSCEL